MKKMNWKRLVSQFLALALCIGLFAAVPVGASDEAPAEAPEETVALPEGVEAPADGAAFGEWIFTGEATAEVLGAWVNNALSESEMKTLLNSQTLYPQRTGWKELDDLMESMLKNAGSTTYEKLRYMYDWLVINVTYSWEGYSNTSASMASYNSVTYDYLKNMTYEDGLQKSIPDDMANRAYHILAKKKGVCYDYAIAFAVIARYIGIESYVRTGNFVFETGGGSGHHGWTIIKLGGAEYVFDPQRDARNYQYYKHNGYYFGIPSSKTGSYRPNYYTADKKANPERDASMLSLTADRAHKVTVTATAGTGGTVSGGGSYITGNQATLTAKPNSGLGFDGWYDAGGSRVSTSASYTFTVKDNVAYTAKFTAAVKVTASASGSASGGGAYVLGTAASLTATPKSGGSFTGWYDSYGNLLSRSNPYSVTVNGNRDLYAMFSGDYFWDVTPSDWYYEEVNAAAAAGIVKGITPITFDGAGTFNRAMAVTMIYRISGDMEEKYDAAPFTDIKEDWYRDAVNWGYANGVVNGRPGNIFDPDAPITREEFIMIMVRYLKQKGYTVDAEDTVLDDYKDVDTISTYNDEPLEAIQKAVAMGLVEGDDVKTLRPQAALVRQEGTPLVLRMSNYMKNNPLPETPETPVTSEAPETPAA